jgi:hypothetical protein
VNGPPGENYGPTLRASVAMLSVLVRVPLLPFKRKKGEKVDWKFKEDAEAQGSSAGFWYDITDGGYLNPAEVLADEYQIAKVNAAVKTLESFELAMEAEGLIQEF